MSSPIAASLDVPTVFPYLGEEELAQPVQPPLTDEEYNAFLLSLSSNSTEFNFPDDPSFLFDANTTIDDVVELTYQNPSDITTNAQPSLNDISPRDFILDCGLDPTEFKSLQTPATSGDADTWNLIIHEMLDKMTEWAKTTDLSLKQMGISAEDLQKWELDDMQF